MIEKLSLIHPDNFDVPRRRQPLMVWQDWDRALGRVEPTLERLWAVTAPYGVDTMEIKRAYIRSLCLHKAGKDGGSYEPITAVQRQVARIAAAQRAIGDPAPVTMAMIAADYAAYRPDNVNERLIYPDAPGLVYRLNTAGTPNFVKTYGKSEIWQRDFKVAGGGYSGYVESLTHTNKAADQEAYRNPLDGTFDCYEVTRGEVTAIIMAAEVAGIDDKVTSLVGGPKDFTGYLLRRPDEEVLEAQKGIWPESLTISSLGQLAIQEGRLVRLETPVPDHPTEMPVSDVQYVPIRYADIR